MKKLIFILITCISFSGFGQDTQLTKDFIKDKDGSLGLREKYIKKNISGSGSYEFNEIYCSDYFKEKTKEEIIKLLGTPDKIIEIQVKKRNENGIRVNGYNIKVDRIVYFISQNDLKCESGTIYGQPMIYLDPKETLKQKVKGKIKSVYIGYGIDCSDKLNEERKEYPFKLEFSFYLETEK